MDQEGTPASPIFRALWWCSDEAAKNVLVLLSDKMEWMLLVLVLLRPVLDDLIASSVILELADLDRLNLLAKLGEQRT